MDLVKKLEKLITEINEENIEPTVHSVMNMFDYDFPYSFNFLISRLLYSTFASKIIDKNVYIQYLSALIKEDEKIIHIFNQYLLKLETQESHFLLYEMIEQKITEPDIAKNLNTLYFKTEEPSKNDWELHKKLIEEGVNPNEIAKIIRNDEVEKLQEISSQNKFDFNQTIPNSLYERCSFINEENVSLIDYAAFFSSVKCFKYLLMNGANVKNTGKYAVAGGNIELIHLCEQNHSSFKDAYETAIEFHRNDIFHYLYENKLEEINNLEEIGKFCISFDNYEIFAFLLEKEGMEISDKIVTEFVKNGNMFLFRYFKEKHQIKRSYLRLSIESGNPEMVEVIQKELGIDVNEREIFLLSFMLFYFI